MASTTQTKQATPLSKWHIGTMTIALALLAIIFVSVVWFNRYVFDTKNFTDIVTPAITSESSTRAIASEVTDQVLQDKPLLRRVIGDREVRLLSALLSTDLSNRVIQRSVSTLQTTMTSPDPQSVTIDLSGTKNTLSQGLAIGRSITNTPEDQQRINTNDIPDEIVLLDANNVPNFYTLGTTLMWLSPLILLSMIVLFVYPLYRASKLEIKQVRNILGIQGSSLLLAGILATLLGIFFKPIALASIANPNARVIAENVYDAFIGIFTTLASVLIITPAVFLLLVALGIWLWPTIFPYVSGLRSQSSRQKS